MESDSEKHFVLQRITINNGPKNILIQAYLYVLETLETLLRLSEGYIVFGVIGEMLIL